MDKYLSEIPRGQMSTIILSALLSGDKYGYEIIDEVTRMTNGKIVIKQPTLYSTLKKLESQKLITTYVRDSEIGGKRRYSRLTDYGKKQVEKWREDLLNSQKELIDFTTLTNSEKSEDDGVFLTPDENIVQQPAIESKQEITTEQSPAFAQQEDLFSISSQKTEPEQQVQEDNLEEQKPDTYLQFNLFDMGKAPISTPNVDSITPTVIPQKDEISERIASMNLEGLNQQQPSEIKEEPKEIEKPYDITEEIKKLRENKKSFINKQKSNSDSHTPTPLNNDISKLDVENKVENNKLDNESEINYNFKLSTLSNNVLLDPTPQIKDDAVFITETPDISSIPHVKKIEPAKLTLLDVENSDLKNRILEKARQKKEREKENPSHQELVSDLYEQGKTESEEVYQDYEQPVKQSIGYFNSYDALKNHFDTNSIYFGLYKKRKEAQITSTGYIYSNKINFVSSSILLLLSIIMSLSLYFGLSHVTTYGTIIYLILPCLFLIAFLFKLCTFVKNKDKKIKANTQALANYTVRITIFVLISLFVLAINLLIGMSFNNVVYFLNTLIYPISLAVLIIAEEFIIYLIKKNKAFKV